MRATRHSRLVRVGGPDAPDLARVLDCGAEGIVMHPVETAARATHKHGSIFGKIRVADHLLSSHAMTLVAGLIVATHDINLPINHGLAVVSRLHGMGQT
jgi:2-keto-3-deoxy-L-rhamnonate aldolase RhmA